jgi:hypothetical protein
VVQSPSRRVLHIHASYRIVMLERQGMYRRGVEQRQLDWLITNRPRVRVPAPQPGIHVIRSVIKTSTNGPAYHPTRPHDLSANTSVIVHGCVLDHTGPHLPRPTHNPKVEGSNPSPATRRFSRLSWVIFTFGCDSPSQQGSRGRSTP